MQNLKFDLDGFTQSYRINDVAKQTNGSILVTIGDTVMLATVVVDYDKKVEEDFLPLTVQYIEKQYAAHKIPGGYIKRESKPSIQETLVSRVIDRAIRPLFPQNFNYEILITIMVMSAEDEADLTVTAINAASLALFVSNIPIDTLVTALRITNVGGSYKVNPSLSELSDGSFDMLLCGDKENIFMIEFAAKNTYMDVPIMTNLDNISGANVIDSELAINVNELSEEELCKIFELGKKEFDKRNNLYLKEFSNFSKEKVDLIVKKDDKELKLQIEKEYQKGLRDILFDISLNKKAKIAKLKELSLIIDEKFNDKFANIDIKNAIDKISKEIVRKELLNNDMRIDGRTLTQIRDINIEINILPNAHSSALFTRGETQVLSILTIGDNSDAQMFDKLSSTSPFSERFMLHYNFNNFSVGEVSKLGPPNRRELGHGALAKKAILPTIMDSSRVYRIVSEVLESNGSSSMATVCSASLALKAGKIDIDNLTAGIAMGLVIDKENINNYKILSDISGLEDSHGDLDFKIAGTKNGITALQMDTKVKGLSTNILKEALIQANEGRNRILNIMEESSKNITYTKSLPSYEIFSINPSYIGEIIGQAGKTIKNIIEMFNVGIDVDKKNGNIKITSDNTKNVQDAKEYINDMTKNKEREENVVYFENEIVKGKVARITDFGAFIDLERGGNGLLHISKLSEGRVNKVTDVINIGDNIAVEVLSHKGNKIELSLKEIL